MHLRVRPLIVLIELSFLFVLHPFATLFVSLIALGPHLGQALFARLAFVLHELLRGVMQFFEDWFDSGLLIAYEIKLLGQQLQLRFDGWHVILRAALAALLFVSTNWSGRSLLRGRERQ